MAKALQPQQQQARPATVTRDGREDILREAIAANDEVEDAEIRAYGLTLLLPLFPPEQRAGAVARAWEQTQCIVDHSFRVRALCSLVPHLSPDRAKEAIRLAISDISRLSDAQQLAAAVRELVACVPASMSDAALKAVSGLAMPLTKIDALTCLARRLPSSKKKDILTLALAEFSPSITGYFFHRPFEDLAALLPGDLVEPAISKVSQLDPAQEAYTRSSCLIALRNKLSELNWHLALDCVEATESPAAQAFAVEGLAPHMPPSIRRRAAAFAKGLRSVRDRTAALGALANRSPISGNEVFLDILRDIQATVDEGDRASALEVLAHYLPVAVWPEAIQLCSSLQGEAFRARALLAYGPGLSKKMRLDAFNAYLTRAKQAGDDLVFLYFDLLAKNCSFLYWRQLLEFASEIKDSNASSKAFRSFIPYLPPFFWLELIGVVQSRFIDNELLFEVLLSDQAPDNLRNSLAEGALQYFEEGLAEGFFSGNELSSIIRNLPSQFLKQATTAAKGIIDDMARVEALGAISVRINGQTESLRGAGGPSAGISTFSNGNNVEHGRIESLGHRRINGDTNGKNEEGILDGRKIRETLVSWFEEEEVPAELREGLLEEITSLVSAAAESSAVHAELGPPVPKLSDADLKAIAKVAKKYPWSDRAKDDDRSPFAWVRDHYGKWIPGLLQSHLRVDMLLWKAFQSELARRKKVLPDWLDVPSQKDATLRNAAPAERPNILGWRKVQAQMMRTRRP